MRLTPRLIAALALAGAAVLGGCAHPQAPGASQSVDFGLGGAAGNSTVQEIASSSATTTLSSSGGAPGDNCMATSSGLVRCAHNVGPLSPALANPPGELLAALANPQQPAVGSEINISGTESSLLSVAEGVDIILAEGVNLGTARASIHNVVLGHAPVVDGKFSYSFELNREYTDPWGYVVDLAATASSSSSRQIIVQGRDSTGAAAGIVVAKGF